MKKNIILMSVLLITSFNTKCVWGILKGLYGGAQEAASAQVFNRALGLGKEALRVSLEKKEVGALVGLAGTGILYAEYRNGLNRNTDCRNVALGMAGVGVSVASVAGMREPASVVLFTLYWGGLTLGVTGMTAWMRLWFGSGR